MKTMAEMNYSTVYDFERHSESADLCGDEIQNESYDPVPKPFLDLTKYEEILNDPSLSRGMHTPDYFLLVE
jgi:hypothetical protein